MTASGAGAGRGADAATAARRAPAEALRDFAVFSSLGAEDLADLAGGIQHRVWSPGALLFLRGDVGDNMLAVQRGRVRLSLSSAQGREILLATVEAGEVLGEMALIDGQPRSADATALEETACLVLPRPWFEAVARRRPAVPMALARHLCRLLRRTNYQMESIALYDLQTRLVRYLLSLVAQSPGAGRLRSVSPGLSQGEIAAILGASRPKVSQAFQALLATGAVRREGEALVCDVEALGRLAEGPGD